MPVTGLLYSQVGYDVRWPKRAVVRGPEGTCLGATSAFVIKSADRVLIEKTLTYWGKKWGSHWWIADFSEIEQEGSFELIVHDHGKELFRSESFDIGKGLLWRKTWKLVALDQSERRARLAMNRVGWQDCGAAWQEANSHAAMIIGLCDLLEFSSDRISSEELKRLETQIINGCDYLALLQDRAAELGLGDGAVSHQKPIFEEIATISDASKASVAWARSSRFLSDSHRGKKCEYRHRSVRAFRWAENAKPNSEGFSRINHGAPKDYIAPSDWMSRDLWMMCWSAFELATNGDEEFRVSATDFASRALKRQISQEESEGGLYGHFRTFDDSPFTEKAWIHSVDSGKISCDTGGHYPNYIIPLLRLLEYWPDHPDAAVWSKSIHDFAYGYFLPSVKENPFSLIPLGYFTDIGLLWFSGLWHGMNGAYACAATLALEFERLFNDQAFRDIVTGNLQWICGLNAGITAEGIKAAHMYSADLPEGVALPISMINGIGRHWAGCYLNVRGSICNGFSTGEQFIYDIEPSVASDGPNTFTDEDWITHAGAWLGALARLR